MSHQKPYVDGPFAGPPLSPSTSAEELSQAVARLSVKDTLGRERLSNARFQKLIDARIKQTAALRRTPESGLRPELVESSNYQPPSGVLKDVFLVAVVESHGGASLRERMKADDRFSMLGDMVESLLGGPSMSVVCSFIDSQPTEKWEELCRAMVRDIMAEILRGRRPALLDLDSDDESLEASTVRSTVRAALEILVEKDDALDWSKTCFREMMLTLEIFRRNHGIESV